jgi:universal stress protein E
MIRSDIQLEMDMKRSIRRILVAVKQVRRRASPTLEKAAALARALDADLELFHAISQPLAIDALMFAGEDVEKFKADERARYVKGLDAMAEPLRQRGLKVTVAADWDYPAHQAIVRRARRSRADLIVAERHAGKHVAPWVLRYNDWELLRNSPVPVLLVKTRRPYGRVRVLAAVDPSHAFAKTAGLDNHILRAAVGISGAARGQLQVVHAYVPSLLDVPPAELTEADAPARIVGHAASLARRRLTATLRAARLGRLPDARRHLVARHPVDAIPQLVKALGIDIVVMGLARSGLKRLLIGNTAEQLVDELPCDLLIIKPPGFATKVPPKPRGPQLIALGAPYGMA